MINGNCKNCDKFTELKEKTRLCVSCAGIKSEELVITNRLMQDCDEINRSFREELDRSTKEGALKVVRFKEATVMQLCSDLWDCRHDEVLELAAKHELRMLLTRPKSAAYDLEYVQIDGLIYGYFRQRYSDSFKIEFEFIHLDPTTLEKLNAQPT